MFKKVKTIEEAWERLWSLPKKQSIIEKEYDKFVKGGLAPWKEIDFAKARGVSGNALRYFDDLDDDEQDCTWWVWAPESDVRCWEKYTALDFPD